MFTLADAIAVYKPPLLLTRILSRRVMRTLRWLFLLLLIISGAGFVFAFTAQVQFAAVALGCVLIFSALWIEQVLLYAYHNTFYFRGLNSIIGLDEVKIDGCTYDVAQVVYPRPKDVTRAFIESPSGREVLLRCGLSVSDLDAFVGSARQALSAQQMTLSRGKLHTLTDLGELLLQQDDAFAALLSEHGIQKETYFGALRWVVGQIHQRKRRSRWWSKDNLSRSRGLGHDWSYGRTYVLERFAKDINTSAVFSTLASDTVYAQEKIEEIESALARSKAANVLIIGEAGVGKIDLLIEVSRRMERGLALSSIDAQRMVVIDTNRFFSVYDNKQDLEQAIVSLFDEAARAGNIILVIENLSTFISEALSMDVHIPELLDQYLATPSLHIAATDTPGAYHTHLEPLGGFVRRFQEILIEPPDRSSTINMLQSIVARHERSHKVLFTYPALQAIVSGADRYLVQGVMPDKAIDLLIDVASRAEDQGMQTITDEFVYAIISELTNIPAGPINEGEREKLLNLEDILHQRVVGQDQAIAAIARTMRRARAGVQNEERPIGSFLFLGPTGVGKTETAKALAYVFFQSEDSMNRIDMSEFSGEGAVGRLIGDDDHSGVLADMLREHPYCVLLLDELEKASEEVHDLFLQVLDEGEFTDGRGGKVNARNSIIIATSNAGSSLIMRTVQQRNELSHLNDEIINHIIKNGIFKSELINRFDNTIIFEPLTQEEQNSVASLMLTDLKKRIREKGYQLVVSPELLTMLVQRGYSPEFGARPMQRVIQDHIEEKVSRMIIGGEVSKGETITLGVDDFPAEGLDATV